MKSQEKLQVNAPRLEAASLLEEKRHQLVLLSQYRRRQIQNTIAMVSSLLDLHLARKRARSGYWKGFGERDHLQLPETVDFFSTPRGVEFRSGPSDQYLGQSDPEWTGIFNIRAKADGRSSSKLQIMLPQVILVLTGKL